MKFLLTIVAVFFTIAGTVRAAAPNIVVILADDMGVGDVSALNPKAAWRTPQLDRMAMEGRTFTDAHSASAVCTPTRYSLLTGRYSWRGVRKSGVTNGYDAAIIEPGRATIASMLRNRSYVTAGIGKWHLGLNWVKSGSKPEEIDYAKPFAHGPTALGFDTFYGISASLDMPPYVYLNNDRAEAPPVRSVETSASPAYWRGGPIAADFRHDDVLPRFTAKAEAFIAERAAAKDGKPFFLYLALASPHTPISPSTDFAGKSRTTPYGDFVVQTDATVGRVLAAIEKHGFTNDTLVVFTADNGCSPQAQFAELEKFGHDPQAGRRGAKADLYEGGHRVPFIARWPGRIKPGTTSAEMVGLTDLFATCAELAGAKISEDMAEDSVSLLPALAGDPRVPLHEAIVHHSINGSFAIRSGNWKLLLAPDSGGWSEPRPRAGGAATATEAAVAGFQLFDLTADPVERNNLATQHPEVVQRLGRLAKRYVLEGRSSPGAPIEAAAGSNWPQLAWMKRF